MSVAELFKTGANSQPQDEIKVISGGEYYETIGLRELAHGVKKGERNSIAIAAKLLASKIQDGSTLVPMPSSCGFATYTLTLAKQIAKEKEGAVAVEDILKGCQRETLYSAKKRGSLLSSEEFGFVSSKVVDGGSILIDNVLATGLTYAEANKAVPDSQIAVIAVDSMANNLFSHDVICKVDSKLANSIIEFFEEEWLRSKVGITPETLGEALRSIGFYGAVAAENLPTTYSELSQVFDEMIKGVLPTTSDEYGFISYGISDKDIIEGWITEQQGNYDFSSSLSRYVEAQYDLVSGGDLQGYFLGRVQERILNRELGFSDCSTTYEEHLKSAQNSSEFNSEITSKNEMNHKPLRPRV
ncbi:hypothetical protein OTK49_26595 [Vibrio coralliirubri]|uniref:hypothetical protein n=1 Tax=Vibrio coralliirubri TaxID=1516159 RepID=UPI00228434B4|nr:hypothetical protein [Vibrio coralliirubri]MCY9866110.1 hypothetical protein [Vibrio coralliirubri]